MRKSFTVIFCLLIALVGFSQTEIDFQNKRLMNSLRKNGIPGSLALKEMNINHINKNVATSGRFFKVTDNNLNCEVKYVYIGRVNSCRTGGCSSSASGQVEIETEYFDYFIFFDSEEKVNLVEVFNYQATHGYEITAKGWLKQFIGFSEKDSLEVSKNIDSISGATISVYAITSDVQEKTRLLKLVN